MNYKISAKARLDLIGIWEFTIKNWSVEQADKYYQIIVDKFTKICVNPEVGNNYDSLRKGYRGLKVKSHIVFYKLNNQKKIEIIRILHQRMDYKSIVEE